MSPYKTAAFHEREALKEADKQANKDSNAAAKCWKGSIQDV